jgi:hypothetical protein
MFKFSRQVVHLLNQLIMMFITLSLLAVAVAVPRGMAAAVLVTAVAEALLAVLPAKL